MSAARYYVHDRKVGSLTTFSAVSPRYWVIDRETGLAVDEFASKRAAADTAQDLNASVATCEWWAACGNEATHTHPHPILGAVPICDRCESKLAQITRGHGAGVAE